MNAEIIAVGSELLLGQITNTNATYISNQLSELGINVYYHTVIGDNPTRLKQAIEIAERRADLLIFSGGLGPTKDDLTKETIAQHLQAPLVFDEAALTHIENYFAKRNMTMTKNNRKQALIIEGSEVLANHHGMAPGMLIAKGRHTYILLPGPPKELHPMFQYEAKPKLAAKLNENGIITSHVMRFYGIGEAALEDQLADILEAQTNPTIAPLATDGEVTLRITAKAQTQQQADVLIRAEVAKIQSRVGQYQYGINDDSLASKLVEVLCANALTISAAESLTAGLFQSELAEIPGVGDALMGGFVTYTERAKIEQLGIDEKLIEQYGVVSKECAVAMAKAVKAKLGTTIGVGLTGAAGPTAHAGQPVGTIWIAFVIGEQLYTHQLQLSGMRNTNRIRTVKFAYHYILQALRELGYNINKA
ncbi:MAG TPA: competence/damage-inducible protein A [Metalysinibacillus jejuensis]|uniref:Putative competence-damage inducible protein n=1 Tax=Metalysinibacillus jejuensis TaxID=914327 RepID=A0A921T582_9BACL|nr:competence/damage-inducible protein A [Metalysinibacillus jejuensis]HJH10774.1 competence/damage-inducible protein A [Metalysinibacillus jejuensis]